MNIWIALVLGILIGWLVEWVIDWFYWRRPRPQEDGRSFASPDPVQKIRYKTRPRDADDLKKLKGVGPVVEKQFNREGIYTFRQVADLTPDEFEDALGDLLEKFFNERVILRHAKELAELKERGDLE